MYYLLVHANRDIKRSQTQRRTQQYMQMNTDSKNDIASKNVISDHYQPASETPSEWRFAGRLVEHVVAYWLDFYPKLNDSHIPTQFRQNLCCYYYSVIAVLLQDTVAYAHLKNELFFM